MATSDSNTTESFFVPRSRTNSLSRRHKRYRKYRKCCIYLFTVYFHFRGRTDSLLKIIWKTYKNFFFSLVGSLCPNSSFLAVLPTGSFLLDAGGGNLFLPICCEVYNISTKMHMYHFISWGNVISLVVNYCKLLNRNRLKIGRTTSRVALTSFYLCLGLPIIMVSISMSIAAGKDGMKSYISET